MRRGLFFLFLFAILAGEGRSEGAETPLRTLMTGDDSRGWKAVGRLNIGTRSFCTGALIAPDLVLTAAHCMFDKTTGVRMQDSEIEFLADWRGGRAAAYRAIRRSIVHPNFRMDDPNFAERVAFDVAILELSQPIRNGSIEPFGMRMSAAAGTEVGVVSYAHDRADSASLQEVCHVLAFQHASLILSCDVDFGSSGAPIFVMENGVARIVSLVSAKAKLHGEPVALGAPLEAPLQELMALRAQGDGVFGRPEPVVSMLSAEEAHASTGAKFLRP